MSRRAKLAAALILVLAIVFGGCQVLRMSDRPTDTALDKRSGVKVEIHSDSDDARIVLSHDDPPRSSVPLLYDILSDPVKIDLSGGKLSEDARITFKYPEGSNPGDMFVVRWHEQTGQWVPQGAIVNEADKTVSVVTDHFSQWALARWKNDGTIEEQLRAATESRLYENSKLIKGITGLMSLPPRDPGCRQSLPTLKVDTSQFFPGFDESGLICLHYENGNSEKYRISIGNNAGFPINLKLPSSMTIDQVGPHRGNILTVMAQIARRAGGENTLTLQGGQRLTLTLDQSKMQGSDKATIIAKLDYGDILMRLGGTLLEVALPILPAEGIDIKDPKKIQAYVELAECVSRQGARIADAMVKARELGVIKGWNLFAPAFLQGMTACKDGFANFMVSILFDPASYGIQKGEEYVAKNIAKNYLKTLISSRFLALVKLWENLDSFTAMFRSWWQIFYYDSGKLRTKALTFTVSQPPKKGGSADGLPFGWCVYADPERLDLFGRPPLFVFDPCRGETPVPGHDYWKDYYANGGR